MKNSESLFSSAQIKKQLADSSRALADLNAKFLLENTELIKPLLEVTWEDIEPWAQRASRILSLAACQSPELIRPYTSEILKNLRIKHSEGVRRNLLKIFLDTPLIMSKKDKTLLMNICFDYLTGNYSIGVTVYSMDILYKLSLEFPEIQTELRAIIESQYNEGSKGFKSRAIKLLNKIGND